MMNDLGGIALEQRLRVYNVSECQAVMLST